MNFNEIIGQQIIKKALTEAAISRNIAHAYLFEGPEGIGKKTVARAFAQLILCTGSKGHDEACGACANCVMFNNDSHPDYHFFSTEDDVIKIDSIREFFTDINLTSHYSQKKIYIIDGVEKMNIQSQNSILKTVEEPPEDVVIILIATNAEMLLETIRSRTIRYSFRRYSKDEILLALERHYNVSGDNLLKTLKYSPEFIYNFSDGIIKRAIDICSNDDFNELREKTFSIIHMIESRDPLQRMAAAEELAKGNKIGDIIEFMMSYYRDLLVMSIASDTNLLINSDKKDIILGSRMKLNISGIINIFNILRDTLNALKRNANESLLIDRFLIKLQEEYK